MPAWRCRTCGAEVRDSIAAYYHCLASVMIPEHPATIGRRQ